MALAVACLVAAVRTGGQADSAQKPQVAEQYFKNVQVLRGISVKEFMDTMGFFAASLGENCTFCHVEESSGDWSKYAVDNANKQTARKMLGPLWRSPLSLPAKIEGTLQVLFFTSSLMMVLLTSAARNPSAFSSPPPPKVSSANRSKVMCAGIQLSGRSRRSTGAATLEMISHAKGARMTSSATTIPA